MFTTTDLQQLENLMDERPQNRVLIQKLIDTHQFTISKIGHEIRNPLTLIYGTLQLMEAQMPEVTSYKYWTQLLDDVRFANALLDELSAYNNGNHLTKSTFPFSSFMEQLAVSFAISLADTPIEFTSKIEPDLPYYRGDSVKLKEVFLNLLKNAGDAVRETDKKNGQILLHAYQENNLIIIEISDNGCGITKEQLDHIFTPFTTYKKGGTGLGLAITKTIIHAHDGTITVHSLPGEGTTFRILLPIKQESQNKTTDKSTDVCSVIYTA